jgi:FKBP-type peptidyl-prolyl cis-trans isomerase FkpA
VTIQAPSAAVVCALSVCLAASCANAGAGQAAPSPTASPGAAAAPSDDETLYALGVLMGANLRPFEPSAGEIETIKRGMSDALSGKAQADPGAGPRLQALVVGRQKAKGEAFAARAAQEEGAVRTTSGLVFRSLKPGTGPSPVASDKVKVNYRGTLIDGTEFDSSYKTGQPAEFQLTGVIPCWTEGVQRMKVGETARLVCPSAVAYGDRGSPPRIHGGATLVFEVELLAVVGK